MYTLQNPNRRNSAEAKVVSPALDGLSLWHWYVVALLYSESFLVTEGSKPATTEAKSDHMPKNWPAIWFCNLKTKKLDLVQILLDCFRFLGFFFFFPSTPWWTFWPKEKVSTVMMLFKAMSKIFKLLWMLCPQSSGQLTGRAHYLRPECFLPANYFCKKCCHLAVVGRITTISR